MLLLFTSTKKKCIYSEILISGIDFQVITGLTLLFESVPVLPGSSCSPQSQGSRLHNPLVSLRSPAPAQGSFLCPPSLAPPATSPRDGGSPTHLEWN